MDLKYHESPPKHCVKKCLTNTASNFQAFKCDLANGSFTALAFQFTASANYLNEVFSGSCVFVLWPDKIWNGSCLSQNLEGKTVINYRECDKAQYIDIYIYLFQRNNNSRTIADVSVFG